MSLSRYSSKSKFLKNIQLAIFLLLFQGACSFKPLYSKDNLELLKGKVAVYVRGPSDALVREFRTMLDSQGLPSENKDASIKYRLEAVINTSISDFSVSRYSYSTRRKVYAQVHYKVMDHKSGKILDEGSFSDSSSFDLSKPSDFSNYIGEQYSGKNSLQLLSGQLSARVATIILNDLKHSRKNADKKE